MVEICFFLDQHVPKAVAEGLRRRQIDVLTAQEVDRCGHSDQEQLAFAMAEGRVLVTFDDDFLALDAQGAQHAGIAYAKQGTRNIGELIRMLSLIHDVLSPEDMSSHVEFL